MKTRLSRITFAQRSRIRVLLAREEFDLRTITYGYRRLGVAEAVIGTPVDSWLDRMSMEEASDVIGKLEAMA